LTIRPEIRRCANGESSIAFALPHRLYFEVELVGAFFEAAPAIADCAFAPLFGLRFIRADMVR